MEAKIKIGNFYYWFLGKILLVFRKQYLFFLVFFLCFLSFLPVFFNDFGLSVNNFFIDNYVRICAKFSKPSNNIVIIGIDLETIDYIKEQWPWPRDKFAQLLKILGDNKPKAVIFDIVFQHPDLKNPLSDDILAETIKTAGNVYLVSIIDYKQTKLSSSKRYFSNTEKIRKSAKDEGFVNTLVDIDGVVRKFIIYDNELNKYSCAYKVFDNEFNNKRGLKIYSNTSVITYVNPSLPIKLFSAKDVFERKISSKEIEGKIVFIGATAPILQDYHSTPLGVLPGVYIFASTLETLISNKISYYVQNTYINIIFILLSLISAILVIPYSIGGYNFILILLFPLIWVILWIFSIIKIKILAPIFPPLYGYIFCYITLYTLTKFFKYLEYQTLVVEANAVGEMQSILLPKLDFNKDDYIIDIYFKPCAYAAGDFYDIKNIENRYTLLVIFDVAGHGISAAMVTPVLKTVIHLLASEKFTKLGNVSLDFLLNTINNTLITLFKKKMVTAVCCLIDYNLDIIKTVSVGHVPFYVYRNSEKDLEEIATPSYPLGVKKNLIIKENTIKLNSNDFIVLNTDGIIEALDWNGQILGYLKWKHIIKEAIYKENIMQHLIYEINQHVMGRPFEDDVTLVVIKKK